MRILYLAETPIIEIQEGKEGNDMYVSLGNLDFNFDGKHLYQYQEGPTSKEIKEMQSELEGLEESKKEEKTKEIMKTIKEKSKKVLYKVVTPEGLLIDVLNKLTDNQPVLKEYL